MREEDVLIAFMPLLRSKKDPKAIAIYEQFQTTGDNELFVQKARQLLIEEQQQQHEMTEEIGDEELAIGIEQTAIPEEQSPTPEQQQGQDLLSLLHKITKTAAGSSTTQQQSSEEQIHQTIIQELKLNELLEEPISQSQTEADQPVVTVAPAEDMQEQKPTQQVHAYWPKRTMRNQPGTIAVNGGAYL